MACAFRAHRIFGQDQVVLVRESGDGGPGFGRNPAGAALGLRRESRVEELRPLRWEPDSIVAALPPDLSDGTYAVELSLFGPPPCSHAGELVVLPDVLPELLFTTAVGSPAPLGSLVAIVNSSPGFAFSERDHELTLLDADGHVIDGTAVESGWGTDRLSVRLPPAPYRFRSPTHTFRFGTSPHRVPLVLMAEDV